MEQLIFLRRQLQVGTLAHQQTHALKIKVAEVIDEGNRSLGLELVPREENGDAVDFDRSGPVHLFNLFESALQRAKGNSNTHRQQQRFSQSKHLQHQSSSSYHVAIRLHDLQCPNKAEEEIEVFVSLFHKGSNISSAFLSERAVVDLPNRSIVVFMNVDNLGICSSLFAVFHLYRNGIPVEQTTGGGGPVAAVTKRASNSFASTCRRPYAIGVIGPFSNLK